VQREFWGFFGRVKPKENSTQRLVFVNLQGANQAMKSLQQIDQEAIRSAYPDAARVSPAAWDALAQDVENGLSLVDKRPLNVPLVVLTLKKDEWNSLSAGRWDRLQADFGVTKDQVRARYDATRAQWRPFDGVIEISGVLDAIRNRVDAALNTRRLVWKDIDTAKAFVRKEFETGELSLLAVDVLASYHPDIYQRLMLFHDSLSAANTVIIALPPFELPQGLRALRRSLSDVCAPYFDDFFAPEIPPKRKLTAQCGWNVGDLEDIQRHVLFAASNVVPDQRTSRSVPYTRQRDDT
jgi:hypothetical protein